MPNLADMYKMKTKEVLTWLVQIQNSLYHGFKVEQLHRVLSKNQARKSLIDLILVNDRNKSHLHLITEKNSEASSRRPSVIPPVIRSDNI